MEVKDVFIKQKKYFYTNETKDIDFRIRMLYRLREIIKKNEEEILDALNKDLSKSNFEGYLTEIAMVYIEINIAIKKLKKWAKPKKVKPTLLYFPSTSYIYNDPYGVVLVIGPFNYPFQLLISPLIGAIAAGNCVMLKPSEYSTNTSKVLEKIINDAYDEKYIKVLEPSRGKELVTELLDLSFDYIFFTGSVKVGKIIMEKAAKNLTPVTLELGGKSPCIVDKDADISKSAKRIVWGKFLNCGQTCVAPDYLLVHKDIKSRLLEQIVKEIKTQFGEEAKKSKDYPRIINTKEVNRLKEYIKEGEIYYGGEVDIEDRYISPTILTDVDDKAKVLQEEIFGPIFPVIEFQDIKDVIETINHGEKPLALYYFSNNKNKIRKMLSLTTSGGVTINDTVIHVGVSNLPFGGVGNSGIGNYHGKASFDTFTHKKSVIKRGVWMEFSLRFAPYKNKISILKKIVK